MKYIILVLVVIILAFGFWTYSKNRDNADLLTHNEIAGPAYLKSDAADLKETIVTPHLEQKIVPQKNILWCSTVQLAWNELIDLNGGPISLKPNSPAADILNKKSVTKNDLDDASYVAMAGFAEDGVKDKIKQELNKKFHGQESPDLLNKYAPDFGFIAYGYLFKTLPFKWAFDRFSMKFFDKPVQCFGIGQYYPDGDRKEARQGSQVSIIDPIDNDNFIVELKTLEDEDRLILAKVPPEVTLQETVKMVQNRVRSGKPIEMEKGMDLEIPVLDFDLFIKFKGFGGNTQSSNQRLQGSPIIAMQSIRFRLDETGAVLKSEGMAFASVRFDNLVFDKPFLVLLQRKDSENPYFAAWIGNTELLIPSDK